MIKYSHILFDLDHTLWDTHTNARQTIMEMFSHFQLEQRGITNPQKFISIYININEQLWTQYSLNQIEKTELRFGRFRHTLNEFGIGDETLVEEMSNYFAEYTPQKSALIENAKDLLDFLSGKYQLHIVTNGFREAQHSKLKSSGIESYFNNVFISEEIGFNKPHGKFFEFVLNEINAQKENVLMVGDNLEADVAGAANAGIDCVFYNPQKISHQYSVAHDITSLQQLKEFL